MENRQLDVDLGERSYPIYIGENQQHRLLHVKEELISECRKVVVLIDQGLLDAHPSFTDEFLRGVPYLKIPSGESSKSIEWLKKSWDFLASEKVDRSSLLVAIGGGVTGDLGGFVAASYLRGVDFIQVPTTLLAMVDSSVGGKTGINLTAGKNLVGAFHQPTQVIIDLSVLSSLPKREFSAGIAEVLKYGLLGNVSLYQFFKDFEKPLNPSSPELSGVIYKCCLDKAKIVQNDETESAEQGGRALLNLGHTFAHAFEAVAGYGRYLHGEAVSIGLVCAFRLSQKMGFCEGDSEHELLEVLEDYDLPTSLTAPLSVSDLMEAMQNDKKVHKGEMRFVLMKEIGSSFVEKFVNPNLVSEVLKSIGAR
jgi:3-dehydroquinate synthase